MKYKEYTVYGLRPSNDTDVLTLSVSTSPTFSSSLT